MARDPGNVNIWQDAHVWTALASGARPAIPADASTVVDELVWFEIGILDGDAGIGEERASDETEHFGWGIGLIKIGNKNFKLTRTFSALEDNDTTRSILWPNSTETALFMPKPVNRYLGFETISDLGVTERLWTVKPARLSIPANNRNESDITTLEITANIFADGTGKLFDRQVVGQSVVKTFTITGSPTGGTFTITVDGQTTSGIAFDAAASAVDSALEALSSVGAGKVAVTGSAGGPYTATFTKAVTTVTASGTSLTPSGGVSVS